MKEIFYSFLGLIIFYLIGSILLFLALFSACGFMSSCEIREYIFALGVVAIPYLFFLGLYFLFGRKILKLEPSQVNFKIKLFGFPYVLIFIVFIPLALGNIFCLVNSYVKTAIGKTSIVKVLDSIQLGEPQYKLLIPINEQEVVNNGRNDILEVIVPIESVPTNLNYGEYNLLGYYEYPGMFFLDSKKRNCKLIAASYVTCDYPGDNFCYTPYNYNRETKVNEIFEFRVKYISHISFKEKEYENLFKSNLTLSESEFAECIQPLLQLVEEKSIRFRRPEIKKLLEKLRLEEYFACPFS